MKILAVDYGERRTGLAVSDDLGITAQGLDTIEVEDESEIVARVARAAADTKADRIVVGLPLNMNGSESDKSRKVREFGEALGRETSLQIVYWDERMTSMEAQRVMRDLGKKTRGNKPALDRISATLILQAYMRSIP